MTDNPADDLGRSYEAMLHNEPAGDAADEHAELRSSLIPPEQQAPPPTERIIEAMLFVGGEPLTPEQACGILRDLSAEQFHQAIELLNREYLAQGRPYSIQHQGPGYVLALKKRHRVVLERLYGSTKEAQLSQTAVDVLALVAYRQPATRQEIDTLRGAESGSILRQLVRRGLIAVVQRGQADQKEVAYGTTPRFLELFGLKSLDDLPRTQDLQQL
jgi:segregation and condensation protein B